MKSSDSPSASESDTDPIIDVGETSTVTDCLRRSTSQDTELPDTVMKSVGADTLELLGNDSKEAATSEEGDQNLYSDQVEKNTDESEPLTNMPGATSVSVDVAQMLNRLRSSDEQESQTLGEFHARIVPGMGDAQKGTALLLQPKPSSASLDREPEAKSIPSTSTIGCASRSTARRRKTKKRGGKGSYRCTLCGVKKENHICRAISIAEVGTQTEEHLQTEGCKFIAVGVYIEADQQLPAHWSNSFAFDNSTNVVTKATDPTLETGDPTGGEAAKVQTPTKQSESSDPSTWSSTHHEHSKATISKSSLADQRGESKQNNVTETDSVHIDSEEETQTVAV